MDRGKKMVLLALNQEFKKKITEIKRAKQTGEKESTDPDYLPSDNFEDSSSSSEDSVNESNETFINNIILNMINNAVTASEKTHAMLYTKKGLIRKRKLCEKPPSERKRTKLEARQNNHSVKFPCKEKCRLKCPQLIDYTRQEEINRFYWESDVKAQRLFAMSCIKKQAKKRSTTKTPSRRENSFQYFLKNSGGFEVCVCKTFLLATLGFDANNDRILKTVRYSDPSLIRSHTDMRGHHPNSAKIDRNIIAEHIHSFQPTISHYRREHAPNRLYLPSDISITLMYKDFKVKHSEVNLSYELYRKQVSEMNISFTKLGHEECFICEKFNLHIKDSGHNNDLECDECVNWLAHKDKYDEARVEYKNDGNYNIDEKLVVSADLQKVIMLPRAEMFKEVIFIPRLIAFNESFVPVKKSSKLIRPIAVIWHEGVTGRKKEDLISTFYAFFLKNRDVRNITIWLDNCAAQNKNWSLFCFFTYIVNCSEVQLENLEVKYLISGHTFMSADSFHHQVELSLKRKSKVLDFNDYKNAVQEANSSNVHVIDMQISDFYDWKDFASKYKLQRMSPKPYLQDMVFVLFKRGEKNLRYKNKFSGEFIELNFLSPKYIKTNLPAPESKSKCKGITAERKNNLIKKLSPIFPANRLTFWTQLEVADEDTNIDD